MATKPDFTKIGAAATGAVRSAIAERKFADESAVVGELLSQAPYTSAEASRIEECAVDIVSRARTDSANRSLLDTFLTQYGLANREGIALMCLAESLLRIPDQRTAERLIADKIKFGDWASHAGESGSLLVNTSTWALLLGSKLVETDPQFSADPGKWLGQLTTRLSQPVIEKAMRAAMRILGREFVLGTSIEKALNNSGEDASYSYDMLGEAARDADTAGRYFQSYLHAINTIGSQQKTGSTALPSISIKLSALHPRYEFSQRDRVLEELVPIAKKLCEAATDNGLELTIDAEEADRLELSLDVFECLARDPDLCSFAGLGLVVQAYGKRAVSVLEWLIALAHETGRRFPVRLVKGAYWDAEIKHAQVHGYPGFPVYTQKPSTDLSYLVCARVMLEHPGELFGQFATHNAHTVAAVMAMGSDISTFEFQRLHGMGATLYEAAKEVYPDFPSLRTYAPVGRHDDLLAYLVRRLLENGANSSFVNRFLDAGLDPRDLVRDPVELVRQFETAAHPGIKSPRDLFGIERRNSAGRDLTSATEVANLEAAYLATRSERYRATPLIFGKIGGGSGRKVVNPANHNDVVGECVDRVAHDIDRAFSLAADEYPKWNALGGAARAEIIEAFAERLEQDQDRLIAILCREAGKTLQDAVDEVREAVDFGRYYAAQARARFESPTVLPGPTGESNELYLEGRGVFACISPWNFPSAIFTGQIVAALAAGNTVVAKPAEETPIIAFETIKHLHAAGVPVNACHLVIGDGAVGDRLVRHPLAAGVAFTGGTDTARKINLAMAEVVRPIAPLIAETGGQNTMIVDSTALLEQVTDDVIQSAFLSAGQRCSALRVLYLQVDIADKAIELVKGAMDELRVGDPANPATDVGPIISVAAADSLKQHIERFAESGRLLHTVALSDECEKGSFVAPTLLELDSIGDLDREHFGPVLHVVRFAGKNFDRVLQDVRATGFGLTFGIHSRIDSRVARTARLAGAGNVYANRNMTGAVVGVQPFGGRGYSGTGPKAGGPNYLPRYAAERVVTVNTVATGGNAELLSL